MDAVAELEAHARELRDLGAKRIGVFGSQARGEATPDSDIDLYVEFADGRKSFRTFNALYEFLEGIFPMRIELVTDGGLEPRKARLILPTVRYASLGD
jgi:predicted nucleotidyltransferase